MSLATKPPKAGREVDNLERIGNAVIPRTRLGDFRGLTVGSDIPFSSSFPSHNQGRERPSMHAFVKSESNPNFSFVRSTATS